RLRHEGLDLDHLRALDLELLQVLVLDLDILALADLVALDPVGGIDGLLGDGIQHLLLQPVSSLAVERVERHALSAGGRVVEGDGARDERELEITLPRGTRHRSSPGLLEARTLIARRAKVQLKRKFINKMCAFRSFLQSLDE